MKHRNLWAQYLEEQRMKIWSKPDKMTSDDLKKLTTIVDLRKGLEECIPCGAGIDIG